MKKKILIIGAFVLIGEVASAQVGVNIDTPSTTMDVRAKRDTNGNITDNTQLVGLQAPRLTRTELTANTATYGAEQKGALIYITDVSGGDTAGARVNITTTGYYSFDGTLWQKIQDTNIYTGNGTLTSNRTATLGGRSLTFSGSDEQTQWTTQGYLYQMGLASSSSGNATISLIAANKDGINGNTRMDIRTFADGDGQILVGGDTKKLTIGSNNTIVSTPIVFSTSSGSSTNGTEKMRITGEGNVGINTTSPTEKVDNNGTTRLRNLPLDGATNAIFTTSAGSASAAQDQTFTATKTVVADANGVMGSVNWVASPPIVIAGADGVDAVPTTQMVRVRNSSGSVSTTALATKTFTLSKKSLVTISYMVTVSNVLAYDGSNLVDGVNKKLGTYASVDGTVNIGSAVPFSNHVTPYATGNFPLVASRSFVLNAGSHTVSLFGEVFAATLDGTGVQATFGAWNDQFDIIAVPIP